MSYFPKVNLMLTMLRKHRLCLILLLCFNFSFTVCVPALLPSCKRLGGRDLTSEGDEIAVPVPTLCEKLPLEDIPTTIEDLFISNKSQLRYGYEFGRPADRFLQFPLSLVFKKVMYSTLP
jgi:hypothetical protein